MEPTYNKFPKIGIWVMPDNNQNCILQDFIFALATHDNVLMKRLKMC